MEVLTPRESVHQGILVCVVSESLFRPTSVPNLEDPGGAAGSQHGEDSGACGHDDLRCFTWNLKVNTALQILKTWQWFLT